MVVVQVARASRDDIEDIDDIEGAVDNPQREHRSLEERLQRIACEEYDFIWRSLRRFGVRPPETDDAAQQVFVILASKLRNVEPGKERSYLFSLVMKVASNVRRRSATRREVSEEDSELSPSVLPSVEAEHDRAVGRAMLDAILAKMPDERRAAFVLVELEELPMVEAAGILGVPVGTIASRVGRAREDIRAAIARLRARGQGV